MAAIKLPPRQRMINMMYLVLTAMLAMNVSKEVLDAFAVLDADLVRSSNTYEDRSKQEYAAFDKAARDFPERYNTLRAQALEVHTMADSLVAHIEGMKVAAIAKAEGRRRDELVGRAANGRDSLLALSHVEAKDDRETLTHALVGSEPAAPKDGPGTAKDLRRRIHDFRDRLKAMCAGRGPELAASLDMLFALEGSPDASGTKNNWESLNFYDVPLAAGIASLSKLQTDIRGAENDMVKWLFRSATDQTYAMSSLASAVIPKSSVVMVGDAFDADVFLAAYDEKNKAHITLNGGADLQLGPDGKGKLHIVTDRVGEQHAEGMIQYQGPNGLEEHPYSVTYQVMAPLLVASPMKMNVLYRGVENPFSLSVPGVTQENLHPVIDNGTVYRKADGWYVRIAHTGTAELRVTATLPDGSSRSIGPAHFRAKDLPPPVAYVGGYSAADTKAQLNKLLAASGMIVKRSEGCEFDEPYVATRYTMVFQRGESAKTVDVVGNKFTQEAQNVLNALRNGDRIYFEGIKARLANGEGPEYTLASLAFKVIR